MSNEERIGDWIQTYTGNKMYPLDPRAGEINIFDIAQSLSNMCRFAGHVKRFYSVAEHSVLVSLHCDPADALWGLLHDASEAYLLDMPRPIKRSANMEWYHFYEEALMQTICDKFGLSRKMPESVKIADNRMLGTEALQLMAPLHPDWRDRFDPYDRFIEAMLPNRAKKFFLDRCEELAPELFEAKKP